jgi:peroxiredoxin/mono/diheme cytochrome c family protein
MIRSLLIVSAVGFTSVAFAADAKQETQLGATAPNAKLADLDGKPVAFADVRGKIATVVVFVSFECPVSNSYAELLNDLARANADRGVRVVLICATTDPAKDVASAAAGFKLAMPVLLDPKKELAAALKARTTPESFVLDAAGVVQYRGRIDDAYSARLKRNPIITTHDLADALAAVVAGKPVLRPVTTPVGCAIDLAPAAAARAGAVTFHKDVAPILNTHCVVCHRQGEVGPFSLTTFNQARRWAEDVKEYTTNRQMPPWMPRGGVAMRDERKLSEKEIATLAAWADAGAPEGNLADAPPAPDFGSGWRHGPPDLILQAGDDFKLGPVGDDLFRVFVVPTGLTENKWVVGYDVKPGNPRVVHHTLHYFDTTGQARGLEKNQLTRDKLDIDSGRLLADRGPGYTTGMGVGFFAPGGQRDAPSFGGIGGWAPGLGPQFLPDGMGWLLPKGADFLIQTHYHRNGQPARDRTQVGLYFAKGPIDQTWQTLIVNGMKPSEKIKAGETDHLSKGSIYLHTDAVLHNVLPHMHLLGKRTKVTMTPPGGAPVVLVDIPVWDYKWQETYWFKEPIHAKVGTKIEIEAAFDNSSANPYNPSNPPRDVKVGEQTTDEMLFGFLGATSLEKPWVRIRASGFPPEGLTNVPPPAKGKMTPELERYLGGWTSTTVVKSRGGPESKMSGEDAVVKAYDGTFLMARVNAGGGRGEVIELITFDTEKNAYRMWTYTGQGIEFEWTGKWNEKSSTLTWTAPLSGELNGVMKWNFANAEKPEIELQVKLGPFAAFTSNSTLTRKK